MAKKVLRQDQNEVDQPAMGGLSESEFIGAAEQNEGFGRDETIIPFTRIMQPLSPQVGVIPGAVPGVFLNLATNTVYEKELIVAPILHQHNYTEWTPRSEGGGFVRDWGEDLEGWRNKCEPQQKTAYQPITKDGHAILIARHFMVLQLQGPEPELSIFPFFGTSLKVARAWSSQMQNAPKIPTSQGMKIPAYFYYTYSITLEETKNSSGRWWLPKIVPVLSNGKFKSIMEYTGGKALWDACVKFRDSLRAGEIKMASQSEQGDPDTY